MEWLKINQRFSLEMDYTNRINVQYALDEYDGKL